MTVRKLPLLALLLVAACKTPQKEPPRYSPPQELAVRDAANATLGAADVLDVRVYQEADLSGPFRVSAEGTIDYPFCGRLKVAGLSSTALVDLISTCLRNGYLKNPQVTVFLKEYNSKKIFVFGEVQKAGTFPFEERMSIIQAITLAGGFNKLAAKNSVIVTRVIEGVERKVKVPVENIGEGRESNFALQPGDIVFVPESFL